MQWLQTKGKLVYEPNRVTFSDGKAVDFRKKHKVLTLIVDLPRDGLSFYYQWFLKKKYGTWLQLQPPLFGMHVTVVRGTELPELIRKGRSLREEFPEWKKHAGKVIAVKYSPEISQVGPFWSLPVSGDGLNELRDELGLHPVSNFHITVGRMYDWQGKEQL